jgi:hypothetical protein
MSAVLAARDLRLLLVGAGRNPKDRALRYSVRALIRRAIAALRAARS